MKNAMAYLLVIPCFILSTFVTGDLQVQAGEQIVQLQEVFESDISEDPAVSEELYSTLDNLEQLKSSVSNTDNAVYELAQSCVAIQSPGTGKFLKKTGTVLGSVYRFDGNSSGEATRFFLKPAALGEYLLTDDSGNYLSSVVPSVEFNSGKPSLASEWRLEARAAGSGRFQFRLKNRLTQHPIQNEYWVMKRIFRFFRIPQLRTDQYFNLIHQGNCRPYPEISANVSGDPEVLRGDLNEPVRGFIDAHAHLTSYEFMGGNVVHGEPFHRWGVPYALSDSASSHGPNGSLDLIGNIYKFGDPTYTYNTRGWPDFPWWPNSQQLSHTGYYYKWMERVWLSGQRMMVTFIVENEVLCNVQRAINPVGWVGNNCNVMDSIRLQVKRLYQMESYIDAQYGGPGKGFFRIVTSPEEARRVIADGKLAILMGVEVSELFNCGGFDYCSLDTIEAGLMELYELGIRNLFIAHKFDNQLSGAVLEEGFINIGGVLSTGHYYQTKECDEDTRGKSMQSELPIIGDIPIVSDLLTITGAYPDYDENIQHHCNIRGLSYKGEYLVNRMIDLGMLIELDHLSADATTQVIDIAEARNYSGLVSSHSFFHKDRAGNLHENFHRMLNLGGFAAPYNSRTDHMVSRVGSYLDAVENTPFLNSVGLGTDMGGLAGQPSQRADADINPLQYPFTTEFGMIVDRQVSGNRTFDFNYDGMAHYGMVADHFQDIRSHASRRVYEALMNSTEGYLQMWERAVANDD